MKALLVVTLIIICFILYYVFFSSSMEGYSGNNGALEQLNASSTRYLDDPYYMWNPYYGIWDPTLTGNAFFWNNGTRYPKGYYPYGALERYYQDSYNLYPWSYYGMPYYRYW